MNKELVSKIVVSVVASIATTLVLWLGGAIGQKLSDAQYQKLVSELRPPGATEIADAMLKSKSTRADLNSRLDGPAALYACSADGLAIKSDKDGATGTIIDFSTRIYDTERDAVDPGGNWKYKAKKSGIYAVSALAFFHQEGTGGTGLCIYVGGKRRVILAQIYPSSASNTTISGTSTITLNEGDTFDIRINTFYDAINAKLNSAGATWLSVHYLRPLPDER